MLISKVTLVSTKIFVANFNIQITTRHESCVFFDLRKIFGHCGTNGRIHDCAMLNEFAILKTIVGDTVGTLQL